MARLGSPTELLGLSFTDILPPTGAARAEFPRVSWYGQETSGEDEMVIRVALLECMTNWSNACQVK